MKKHGGEQELDNDLRRTWDGTGKVVGSVMDM